jgi:hypothetical protein
MIKSSLANILIIILLAFLSFIVIYKAIVLPFTFDEAETWFCYVRYFNFKYTIFNKFGGPNNHILNTLLMVGCQFLFGTKAWMLRLPNILSLFLLFFAIYILAKRYFNLHPLMFCLPFILILCNPYLIDFYSLARGYGMANAFMVGSVVCLLAFSAGTNNKWYYTSVICSMLAAYSNFTFLLFWFALHLLLIGILIYHCKFNGYILKTLVITICLNTGFILLCAPSIINSRQAILYDFYLRDGFYQNTILSCVDRYIYGHPLLSFSPYTIAGFICFTIFITLIYLVYRLTKKNSYLLTNPLGLLCSLLMLVYLINILQVRLTNTAYITNRGALMYYILFILVLLFLLRELMQNRTPGVGVTAFSMAAIFLLHFAMAVNFTSVYEWSFDAYTNKVLAYIDKYKSDHKETGTINLKLSSYFHNSFYFATADENRPWLKITDDNDEILAPPLFYYATASDANGLKHYQPVYYFNPNGEAPGRLDNNKSQVLLLHTEH